MNDNAPRPDDRPSASIHYLTQKPMPLDERDLPEWLQHEVDQLERAEESDRVALGAIATLVFFAAIFALNAWAKHLGYGA